MTHFPRKRLILPPLMPLAVLAIEFCAGAMGYPMNDQSRFIVFATALLSAAFIALLMVAHTMPRAWRLLRQQPPLRTLWNYAAMAVGLAYFLAIAFAVWWYFYTFLPSL